MGPVKNAARDLQSFVQMARLKVSEDQEDPPSCQGHGLGPEASLDLKSPHAHQSNSSFWVQ